MSDDQKKIEDLEPRDEDAKDLKGGKREADTGRRVVSRVTRTHA